jgi:hypothetical protein
MHCAFFIPFFILHFSFLLMSPRASRHPAGARRRRRRTVTSRRDVQRPRQPGPGAGPAHRGGDRRRRRARRGALDARGRPLRVLSIRAGRRPRGGRADRGPGLVRPRRDPFRHPCARGGGNGARHAGRSRSHRQRRLRPDLPEHVQRRPPGVDVRRQPARGADRRRARRRRARGVVGQRVQRAADRARPPGPEPRLRLRVEGPDHRRRLRSRDPDSVPEPEVPAGPDAGLGTARRAPHAGDRA